MPENGRSYLRPGAVERLFGRFLVFLIRIGVVRGHFYVLEVSDTGDVGMWRREADTWVELVPWTRSAAVRSAADGNLIEARASGSRLTLLVNGAEAAGATDSALGPGGIGVFLGGDDNEAILEHLAIQIP